MKSAALSINSLHRKVKEQFQKRRRYLISFGSNTMVLEKTDSNRAGGLSQERQD